MEALDVPAIGAGAYQLQHAGEKVKTGKGGHPSYFLAAIPDKRDAPAVAVPSNERLLTARGITYLARTDVLVAKGGKVESLNVPAVGTGAYAVKHAKQKVKTGEEGYPTRFLTPISDKPAAPVISAGSHLHQNG